MIKNNHALQPEVAESKLHDFATDVRKGLISNPKFLPSKYFYDAKGDFLFQQIMQMEEYYLTRSEYEILDSHKDQLLEHFTTSDKTFDLIELGAGDGFKTKILIEHFLKENPDFIYKPIDISANALSILSSDMKKSFSNLKIHTHCGEYIRSLEDLNSQTKERKIVLFLGSNIGNFSHSQAKDFLTSIRKNLSPGDYLLTGFDLKKNPDIILKAYNDSHGITRAFNLNLLERINRELGGNFQTNYFSHFPVYDPIKGEARSYLVSKQRQNVFVDLLQEEFQFDAWEPIFTEVSKKYDIQQIEAMCETSGFELISNYFDHNKFFVDSLWQAN